MITASSKIKDFATLKAGAANAERGKLCLFRSQNFTRGAVADSCDLLGIYLCSDHQGAHFACHPPAQQASGGISTSITTFIMKSTQLLMYGLAFLVSVLAQGTSDAPATKSCTFSCPAVDSLSRPLVQRPHVIGFNSHYSIFECA
jgi:hypothetical protein